MNRKEFLAVVISAALGLSGAPVYASESAAFSDGEDVYKRQTLVRLAWVILTCFGGAGIWAYIIAAIIIPKR